jgi:hypothetical protein
MRNRNALKGLFAGGAIALLLPALLLYAVSGWAESRESAPQELVFAGAPIAQVNSPLAFDAEAPLTIPAAAFKDAGAEIGVSYENYFFTFAGGYLHPNGGATCLRAPVYLPDGYIMTTFRAFVWDSSAELNFTLQLRRKNMLNLNNSIALASITTSGALEEVQPLETALAANDNAIVNNSIYTYYVALCMPDVSTAHRLYAVEIDHEFKQSLFLPIITNNYSSCFYGAEIEPNNTPAEATGPLCFSANITGQPDGLPNSDYFYFDLPASRSFTVVATKFDPVGQMQLFYETTTTPIATIGDQANGTYQIQHNGAPGRYYIRLISVTNPVGQQTYTLRVNTP